MDTVIDFSASLPSAASIKDAGHEGVMLYCAPGREDWMQGKQPPRSYTDKFRAGGGTQEILERAVSGDGDDA